MLAKINKRQMKIEEFNEWIQTYKNDDDGKFTAYVSTRDLHQLCKDYHKQQLALCRVSQQRELLDAFCCTMEFDVKHETYEEDINYFLENVKADNCG